MTNYEGAIIQLERRSFQAAAFFFRFHRCEAAFNSYNSYLLLYSR